MKYKVMVEVTLEYLIEVEADCEEQALESAFHATVDLPMEDADNVKWDATVKSKEDK